MYEFSADGSDQECPVCSESLLPSGENGSSEVALKLECCGRSIGQDCLRIWLSSLSEAGGGGHTCPLCRKQLISPWPPAATSPPTPRERNNDHNDDALPYLGYLEHRLLEARARLDRINGALFSIMGFQGTSSTQYIASALRLAEAHRDDNGERPDNHELPSLPNFEALEDNLREARARNSNRNNDELFLEPGSQGASSGANSDSVPAATSRTETHRDGNGVLPDKREPRLHVWPRVFLGILTYSADHWFERWEAAGGAGEPLSLGIKFVIIFMCISFFVPWEWL